MSLLQKVAQSLVGAGDASLYRFLRNVQAVGDLNLG